MEGVELRVGAAARAEAVEDTAELVGEVHIALGNRANPFPNSTRWSLPPTPRRTNTHRIDRPGTRRCWTERRDRRSKRTRQCCGHTLAAEKAVVVPVVVLVVVATEAVMGATQETEAERVEYAAAVGMVAENQTCKAPTEAHETHTSFRNRMLSKHFRSRPFHRVYRDRCARCTCV